MILSALLLTGILTSYVNSNSTQYREPDCEKICNYMTSHYEDDFNITFPNWTWNEE